MGQINSVQDSDTANVMQMANKPDDTENDEKSKKALEQQREANSEQVRCVKTRIDMLIEDCLSTNDISADIENERNRHSEISNFVCNQKNETKKENKNENNDNKVIGCEKYKTKMLDITGNSEHPGDQRYDKTVNVNADVSTEKHDSVPEKQAAKTELKVSDIITDMVNTELTQNQLMQIQQRTLTTFNTFIDKVLDSSLINDNEDKPKQTNILKLCSESMLPGSKRKMEDIVDERNEKPECDRDTDKDKTEKKVTLKDHIERFLELSFRDENLKEEMKVKEKKTNSPENFNARGLVNSMITQGLEINHVFTAKEQHTDSNQRNFSPKESELQSKQVKVPAQNIRQQNREILEQRSPGTNSFQDRFEGRNSRALTGQPTADAKFRDHYFNATKYEPSHKNSQIPLGYTRRDVNMDRNHEIPTKLHVNVNSKHEMGIMNNMRPSDHSSAFHQPQNLLVVNNAYSQPGYVPRMQLSPRQIGDMNHPVSRDGKQIIHVRDCTCSMCVQQSHSRHGMVDAPIVDHLASKHSPNSHSQMLAQNVTLQTAVGPVRNCMTSGHLREVPAMVRPSHSELPPGLVAYQGMHKLLPHHPPITSSKVYAGDQPLVPGEISQQSLVPGRRLGMQESPQHYQYQHQYQHRGEEVQQNPSGNERLAIHSGKPSPYLVRPSSVPSQEQINPLYSRPSSGHRSYEPDYTRHTDSLSGSSECSNEAPLDLTVKKPKIEQMRSRAVSNASTIRKINPSNTFIKHLESSVDKYWQEINSPPSSPASIKPPTPVNRSVTPNDGKCATYKYPQQSPNESSPPALLNMLHRGSLPSPHYSGGITLGHPLMDVKPSVPQKQTEYQYSNIPQTGPPVVNHQAQSPSQFQGNQPIFDMASKRSAANISKHEPIQNIIGHNDPNDILYLICRLCTQTYGSPYGFRKHFRNQHGFEPRAEHTIVQTISATKSALHLPQPQLMQPQLMQGMSEICESHIIRKSVSPPEGEVVCQKRAASVQLGRKSSSVSPTDSKSIAGSDEGEKSELENSETKCLECPECGKTFQLNDFGSYKRHCRQHGNVRMNGPFACSDCHLPFPDQKSLREHYIVHVKDTPVAVKQEQKNEGSIHKSESHHTCYACVKCDQQFDNMDTYKCHVASHNLESKTHCKVPPETGECKQTISVKAEDEKSVDIGIINVKQETESNTSIDSSWDNVVKEVATSNKMELNLETSESNCSIISNLSDKGTNKEDTNNENSPVKSTTLASTEIESDSETKAAENEFIYKHKKFFHHRKRANSIQSQSADVSDAKQRKCSESPATVADNVPMPSLPAVVVNTLCDTTGSSEAVESVRSEEIPAGKTLKNTSEKTVKTEARHSLPFVWDRTTRSQKKS